MFLVVLFSLGPCEGGGGVGRQCRPLVRGPSIVYKHVIIYKIKEIIIYIMRYS